MFDRTHKRFTYVTLAGTIAFATAGAAPVHAENQDVPQLSGTYVFNATQNCLPSTGDLESLTGTMTFDPSTGKMKLFEYITSGNPLTLQKGKGTDIFSNSASTFTLDSTTFQAFYGKLAKGVATSFSFIGVVGDGCALQVSLTLQ